MDGMSSPSLNSGCLQNIHREQDLQLAGLEALDGGLAIGRGGGGVEGFGGKAGGAEALGHEAGVLHAHAKTQGAHAGRIGELVVQLLEDQVHAAVIAG